MSLKSLVLSLPYTYLINLNTTNCQTYSYTLHVTNIYLIKSVLDLTLSVRTYYLISVICYTHKSLTHKLTHHTHLNTLYTWSLKNFIYSHKMKCNSMSINNIHNVVSIFLPNCVQGSSYLSNTLKFYIKNRWMIGCTTFLSHPVLYYG